MVSWRVENGCIKGYAETDGATIKKQRVCLFLQAALNACRPFKKPINLLKDLSADEGLASLSVLLANQACGFDGKIRQNTIGTRAFECHQAFQYRLVAV